MPSHNSNFNSPPEKPFYVSETEQLFGDISCHVWSWPWPPSCASRRVAAALSRGAESQPGGFTSPWTLAGVPWINYLFYCSEGRRVFLKHSIPNTRVNSDPSESDTRQASPLQHPRASTSWVPGSVQGKYRVILVGIGACCHDRLPCWFHLIVKIKPNFAQAHWCTFSYYLTWKKKKQNWVIDTMRNLLMNEIKFIKKGLIDLNVKARVIYFSCLAFCCRNGVIILIPAFFRSSASFR